MRTSSTSGLVRFIVAAVAAITLGVTANVGPATAQGSMTFGGDGVTEPINILWTGHTGFWDHNLAWRVANYCAGTNWGTRTFGVITTAQAALTRASAYQASPQTIRLSSGLQVWNGSGWVYNGQWTSWESKYTSAYSPYSVSFAGKSLNVAKGRYYRVVHVYQWIVNGRIVGEARNIFAGFDYRASVGATASAYSSDAGFCHIG